MVDNMNRKTNVDKVQKIEQIIGQLQENFNCPIWYVTSKAARSYISDIFRNVAPYYPVVLMCILHVL